MCPFVFFVVKNIQTTQRTQIHTEKSIKLAECKTNNLCNFKRIKMKLTKQYIKNLNYKIVGAALEVHKQLGPGLLESIYEECLYEELLSVGLHPKRQVLVPVIYKGIQVKNDLKIDLLVNDCIILELKAVINMNPLYDAQILTYMKLAEIPKGLLINFNSVKLTDGISPFVNELFAELPEK